MDATLGTMVFHRDVGWINDNLDVMRAERDAATGRRPELQKWREKYPKPATAAEVHDVWLRTRLAMVHNKAEAAEAARRQAAYDVVAGQHARRVVSETARR